ncbi:unnamed protein product [Auanema sp. JU1783]|nr:unnamed protein product [Auanema sp. JU1783]
MCLIGCSFLLLCCSYVICGNDWSYNDKTQWTGLCATGKQQSPIDVSFYDLERKNIEPLEFHDYNITGEITGLNNGHTELVQGFESWSTQPYITGGGLQGKYYLAQFHFHWDGRDNLGSEHTLNHLHYPLEIHLLHVQQGVHPSNADIYPNSIAVVAVFFEMSDDGTPLEPLTNILRRTIQTSKESVNEGYNPSDLLPSDTSSFLYYNGSLTTPPCSETVRWFLMTQPSRVTELQLKRFRVRRGEQSLFLIDNWRPTQPMNGRKVYLSQTNSIQP